MINKIGSSENKKNFNFKGTGRIVEKLPYTVRELVNHINFEHPTIDPNQKFTGLLCAYTDKSARQIASALKIPRVSLWGSSLKTLNRQYRQLALGTGGPIGGYWENFTKALTEMLKNKGIVDEAGAFKRLPAKSITLGEGTDYIPEDLRKLNADNVIVTSGVKFDSQVLADNVEFDGFSAASLDVVARNVRLTNSRLGTVIAQNGVSARNIDVFSIISDNEIYIAGKNNTVEKLQAKDISVNNTQADVVVAHETLNSIGTCKFNKALATIFVPSKETSTNQTLWRYIVLRDLDNFEETGFSKLDDSGTVILNDNDNQNKDIDIEIMEQIMKSKGYRRIRLEYTGG